MILQQCSINGKKYRILDGGIQEENRLNTLKLKQYHREILNFFQALAVCHTVQVAGIENQVDMDDDDTEMEKSFEVVESVSSLVDLDEDIQRKVETRNNTIQNEINAEENFLADSETIRNDGKPRLTVMLVFIIKTPHQIVSFFF